MIYLIDTSTHRHIDTSTHRVVLYYVVKNLRKFIPVLLSFFLRKRENLCRKCKTTTLNNKVCVIKNKKSHENL